MFAMSQHVILLTDAHEAPAYELIEALRAAGVKTLIEGLREVEAEVALARRQESEGSALNQGPPPLAVLYEVVPGADLVEMQTATDHAKTFWPGTPLVACRRQGNGYQSLNLRNLDGATLKRLGFRAIADKAAQIPALLREIEGHGATGELKLPEIVQKPAEQSSYSLPLKLKAKGLRAAFDLVSSLHFIGDQIGAAHTALAGIEHVGECQVLDHLSHLRCKDSRRLLPGSDCGQGSRSASWRAAKLKSGAGCIMPEDRCHALRIQGRASGGGRHGHH